MALQLFNTLSRRIEMFTPLRPGKVSLYTCGPTVWNYAHIGNFRTFLFEDLLRRWLEASGFEVFHIMNLTDVDDRIISEAGKAGTTVDAFVAPFIKAFDEDRDWLRLRPAHAYPRATRFVAPMIALVERLLANGTAYKGEDGSVYFSIAKFPAYGRLSQLDRRELKTGASERVSADDYSKEDARDWVLWKAVRPEDEKVEAAWDAPFGRGRPGWHLECSAMALDLIGKAGYGDVLDIHAGGVDLIFPHHEDEIAQSCAYTGQADFARYWLHGEFLNVRGTKMSKRFGNITTPRDLREDGVDPGAIRLLLFGTHYRARLDLTDESLAAAREGARRVGQFHYMLSQAYAAENPGTPEFSAIAGKFGSDFAAAMNDDLDAPRALAAMFDFVREGNSLLAARKRPGTDVVIAWEIVAKVLDVYPNSITGTVAAEVAAPLRLSDDPPALLAERNEWARGWAARRREAKKQKNFPEADRIREFLAEHGVVLQDARDGSTLVRIEG